MTTRTWRLTATGSALAVVIVYRAITLVATLAFSGTTTSLHQRNTASSVFAWWDGQWYLRIAQHGYDPGYVQHSGLGARTEAAFPPALAALMSATHRLFALDYTIAGLLWGFLALAVAAVGLVRLIELDYGRRIALLTLGFLLLWPPAIFFGMLYQDGITLAGLVWAFYLVRRQRPALAGITLGIACLGKLVVVVALVALVVEQRHNEQRRHHRTTPQRRRDHVLLAAGPIAAVAGWLLYSGIRFHHLTAALDAERAWGHGLSAPWHSISVSATALRQVHDPGYRAVLIGDFVAIGLLALALGYLALRRTRPSYILYAATMLVVLTTDGHTFSVGRYLLLVFPVFLAAALGTDRLLHKRPQPTLAAACTVTVLAAVAQLWLIERFAHYYWAG